MACPFRSPKSVPLVLLLPATVVIVAVVLVPLAGLVLFELHRL